MADSLATAQPRQMAEVMERVIVQGDLSKLTAIERCDYYDKVCSSMGLNPMTRPFDYVTLNGKLTLYAKRDCADQLRKINVVSLFGQQITFSDGLCIVQINASTPDKRTDSDIGAVYIENLKGEPRANALMKAITKAKRRVTLSICGLGWLDETEVDTIPGAGATIVDVSTGEIIDVAGGEAATSAPVSEAGASEARQGTEAETRALQAKIREKCVLLGLDNDGIRQAIRDALCLAKTQKTPAMKEMNLLQLEAVLVSLSSKLDELESGEEDPLDAEVVN